MAVGAVYRDPREALAARRRELIEERRQELEALPAVAKRAYAWRMARTASSAVSLIGAAFVVITAAGQAAAPAGASALTVLDVLEATWVATMVAGALTWVLVRGTTRFGVASAFRPTGDVRADVARLESTTALLELRELAMRSERISVAFWLSAAAFHVPLVGTCAASWIFTRHAPPPELISYGILASLGGVTTLFVIAQMFARDLTRRQVISMLHAQWDDGMKALGLGVVATTLWATGGMLTLTAMGRLSGVFVLAAFVWMVAATIWVPGMFRYARRVVAAERQALGIESEVHWPRAI